MATHAKREREFAKRSRKDEKARRKAEREKEAAEGKTPTWEMTSADLQEPHAPPPE